ncbi:MAG: nuclear transport factor 2 family protein [Nannocystaceae bacterium]|nr:nuclear transport factor 2 family protein [Nannocystaceae bacterium]
MMTTVTLRNFTRSNLPCRWTRRGPLTFIVFAAALGACDDGEAAPIEGANETQDDVEAIRDVGICLTNGIDLIGAEDVAAGTARWDACFTDDHAFEFEGEIPGSGQIMQVSCPGETCPLPAPQIGAVARAQFAAGVFQANGYVATQHVLSNVEIVVDGDEGSLSGDLTAFHFLPDNSIDLMNGRWESDVVKIDGVWLSSQERAFQTSFINVAATPLGE